MADPVMDTTAETMAGGSTTTMQAPEAQPSVPMVSPALMMFQRVSITDIGHVIGVVLVGSLAGGAIGWLAARKPGGGVVGAGALTSLVAGSQLVQKWRSMSTTGKVGLGVVSVAAAAVAAYGVWRQGKRKT